MTQRVLIVDDEKLIRWSVREALGAEGFEVLEAENAATARVALDTQDLALALFDLRLPDGNGMDLLRYAREALSRRTG